MARSGSENELDPNSEEDEDDSASSSERLGESGCFSSEIRFLRCFPSSAFFNDLAMLSFFCFLTVAL